MEPLGDNNAFCYHVRTRVVSNTARNALGLTGFGSFDPQSCPDMIGLYVAEGSSGPPRKKRGLCLRHSPITVSKHISGPKKNLDRKTWAETFCTVNQGVKRFGLNSLGCVLNTAPFSCEEVRMILQPHTTQSCLGMIGGRRIQSRLGPERFSLHSSPLSVCHGRRMTSCVPVASSMCLHVQLSFLALLQGSH